MELCPYIETRCSVRHFLPRPVEENMIRSLIEAGQNAASAGNIHGFVYLVVTQKLIIHKIAEYTFRGNREDHLGSQHWLQDAAALIIILGNIQTYEDRYAESGNDLMLIDCGTLLENMQIQGTMLGLGSCIVGGLIEESIKCELNLPTKFRIPGLLAIGYPVPFESRSPRKDPEIYFYIERREGNEEDTIGGKLDTGLSD